MENSYGYQLERIDRLMKLIQSNNPMREIAFSLTYFDLVVFTLQSMWHLKDWILNDIEFQAKDARLLSDDIHNERCLLICADLANRSKHFKLTKPKTDSSISDQAGIYLATKENIHIEYYRICCEDKNDEFHWMEIRDFLKKCRDSWEHIISKHYLSVFGV